MTTAQPAIFVENSRLHRFFEVHRYEGSPSLRDIVAATSSVNTVIGFGPDCCARCAAEAGVDVSPAEFGVFPGFSNSEHAMPSTQGDLLLWCHGDDHDQLVDVELSLRSLLVPHDLKVSTGFVYRDSRDLTGFVDGSANPRDDARFQVAQIQEGLPGAGGSYVMTQRWVHRLDEFNRLGIEEQERVIGRTKVDSIELEGAAMPADSHVSRTDLKVNDVAQKIYRRSTPIIDEDGAGLFFLAFSCEQSRFDVLLESMMGNNDGTAGDRLLGFSKAISGSYWFAPSQSSLQALI